MQRKNAFPSHGSLPRQSPYLPTPREKKKYEILSLKTGGSPTRSPGTALGRLLDGRGKLEGYGSLGMFNIKKAIRT